MCSPSSRLVSVALLLFAAACVDPQTTPREFTPENVNGYWAGVAEDTDGGYRIGGPVLLHFGATLSEFPNETQLSEMTFGGSTYFGPYTLSENGTFVQGGQSDVGNIRGAKLFTGRIVSLTGNEMRLEYAEGVPRPPIVLRRTTGCGVPGTWLPTPGRIQSAAWGPDGALHVLFDFDLDSGAYAFVPPGRCSLQRPNVTVSGDGVGVAPNGTVHIIDVRRENPGRPEEGGVFVTEIPAQPWSRPRLDGTTRHLSDRGTSSRPATSVTHLSDSTPILVWGEAGTLHVWRKS
ncbi:MAG TPA: hypothetical protein VK420_23465, partial [Longimicrobium sp.]|nr:hypothetical protein [Longimicrobium sp.]